MGITKWVTTKFREGNVLSHVCLSVHRGRFYVSTTWGSFWSRTWSSSSHLTGTPRHVHTCTFGLHRTLTPSRDLTELWSKEMFLHMSVILSRGVGRVGGVFPACITGHMARGSASRGWGICIHEVGGLPAEELGRPLPLPELRKQTLRILLECFLADYFSASKLKENNLVVQRIVAVNECCLVLLTVWWLICIASLIPQEADWLPPPTQVVHSFSLLVYHCQSIRFYFCKNISKFLKALKYYGF